tara:strand:- start:210 stop:470 length:261 start_codon:yes stop_codon:yes gene_type:complete
MHKRDITIGGMLVFGIGMFAGVMMSNQQNLNLKLQMAEELQGYINEIRYNKHKQEINVNVANYYIQEMQESIDELLYIEQETQYYE